MEQSGGNKETEMTNLPATGGQANLNGEHPSEKRHTRHSKDEEPVNKLQEDIFWLVNCTPMQVLLNVITGYALFGDDFRTCVFNGEDKFVADNAFLAVSSFAFVLFNLELMMQMYATPGYFPWPRKEGMSRFDQFKKGDLPQPDFYFWLDLIATWSLVFELTWLLEGIGGGRDPMLPPPTKVNLGAVSNDYTDDADDVSSGGSGGVDGSAAQSARAGRASRAGAKAGRIVRIVRMVRLIRIVKVFKGIDETSCVGKMLGIKSENGADSISPEEEDEEEEMLPESHVGKSLSDLTQRRVIVGVLATLLTLPLLEYPYSNETALYTTRLAHSFLYRRNVCTNSAEIERIGEDCTYLGDGLNTANAFMLKASKNKMKLLAGKHIIRTAQGFSDECLAQVASGGGVSSSCSYSTKTTVFYGTI
jgi:hypothetical protein